MIKKRKLNKKNCAILLAGIFAVGFVIFQLCSFVGSLNDEETKEPKVQSVLLQQEIAPRTIVLDAGHGGYDDGAIAYNGYKEKEITLSVTKKVKAYLAYYNVEAIMTRESDEVTWSNDNVEDLRARSTVANNSNAEYFVSIHCNSAEPQDEAKGSEIFVYFDQEKSYLLADTINTELKTIQELENREMKDVARSPLQLLLENRIPGCIIEMGFLTDQVDADFMISEAGQNKLSASIAKGILHTLGIQIEE